MAYQERQPQQNMPYNNMYLSMMALNQGLKDANMWKSAQLAIEGRNAAEQIKKENPFSDTGEKPAETPADPNALIQANNATAIEQLQKAQAQRLQNDPNAHDADPVPDVIADIDNEYDNAKSVVNKRIAAQIANEQSDGTYIGKIGMYKEILTNIGKSCKVKSLKPFYSENVKNIGHTIAPGKGITPVIPQNAQFVEEWITDKYGNRVPRETLSMNTQITDVKKSSPSFLNGAKFDKITLAVGGAVAAVKAYKNYQDKGLGYATARGVVDAATTTIGAINPYVGMAVGAGADALENYLNSLDDDIVKQIGDAEMLKYRTFSDIVKISGKEVTQSEADAIKKSIESRIKNTQEVGALGKMVSNIFGGQDDTEMALQAFGSDKTSQIINIRKAMNNASDNMVRQMRDGKMSLAFESFAHAKEMERLYGELGQDRTAFSRAIPQMVYEDTQKSLRQLTKDTDMENKTLREITKQREKQISDTAPVPKSEHVYDKTNEQEVILQGLTDLVYKGESKSYETVNNSAYGGNNTYGDNGTKITGLTMNDLFFVQGSTNGEKGKYFGAAGKYQFTHSTLFGAWRNGKWNEGILERVAREENLDLNELYSKKFDQSMQDWLAIKKIQYHVPTLWKYLHDPNPTHGQEEAALKVFGKTWEAYSVDKFPERKEAARAVLNKMRTTINNLNTNQPV